jgi:hypothetical protein
MKERLNTSIVSDTVLDAIEIIVKQNRQTLLTSWILLSSEIRQIINKNGRYIECYVVINGMEKVRVGS